MSANARDPFGSVLGAGRGSARPDDRDPEPRWWLKTGLEDAPWLAGWLDDIWRRGPVGLELVGSRADGVGLHFVWPGRLLTLTLEDHECEWLLRTWPAELREPADDGVVAGRLAASYPVRWRWGDGGTA